MGFSSLIANTSHALKDMNYQRAKDFLLLGNGSLMVEG
jgi:hypothetical protein